MSKISKAVSNMQETNSLRLTETVTNFMGGDSYTINPLDTLKMITASSIFGEPSYYRGSKSHSTYAVNKLVEGYSVLPSSFYDQSTEDIMEEAIDKALDFDFKATLEWAVSLRKDFYMRLNPQVIMVRAAIHPKRKEFTEKNPGMFDSYNRKVMSRADEAMSQMAYYLYNNSGAKNNIPSILKRSWAKNLSKQDRYNIARYKNHEIGMVNAVRLCHAHSDDIDELMKTGTVSVTSDQKTWENLRSEGKSWVEIFDTVGMGHMALLRNLRGVFTEVNDLAFCKHYVEKLKHGVLTGKQLPFRYYSAYQAISDSNCNHRAYILDALEDCIDLAMENLPKLKGKTMCLSDNSGSAWGAIPSEYGTVTVAKIDNLSSVITAQRSDEGYVGMFGDRLIVNPITRRDGILSQTERLSTGGEQKVGPSTEGGIWEFFKKAIKNKEHWDNIFIYSDQQAGHGGLYGTPAHITEYNNLGFGCGEIMINVFKLVQEYRKQVNPKVNVFSVQTAGYDNSILPEYAYRTSILYGWTGKELLFADTMIKQWDEIESKNSAKV